MNALISVSDKTGVLELAQALHGLGIALLPAQVFSSEAETRRTLLADFKHVCVDVATEE